jgi:hypothetical protein
MLQNCMLFCDQNTLQNCLLFCDQNTLENYMLFSHCSLCPTAKPWYWRTRQEISLRPYSMNSERQVRRRGMIARFWTSETRHLWRRDPRKPLMYAILGMYCRFYRGQASYNRRLTSRAIKDTALDLWLLIRDTILSSGPCGIFFSSVHLRFRVLDACITAGCCEPSHLPLLILWGYVHLIIGWTSGPHVVSLRDHAFQAIQ